MLDWLLDRQTNKQIDWIYQIGKKIGRQTNRQTEKQTDRQIDTQNDRLDRLDQLNKNKTNTKHIILH